MTDSGSHVIIDADRLIIWCEAVLKSVREERQVEKDKIVSDLVKSANTGFRGCLNRLFRRPEKNHADMRAWLEELVLDWDHPWWHIRHTGGDALNVARRLSSAAKISPRVTVSTSDINILTGWSTGRTIENIFGERPYR